VQEPKLDHHGFPKLLRHAAACVLLVVVTCAVFAPACSYPLLHGWDDNEYVTNNAALLEPSVENVRYWFTHPCVGHYIPLTMLSYMADSALWGLNHVGCHAQSLAWHVLAVLGVYSCFCALGVELWLGLLLTLIFAVHPQRVESVVWVSERKDVFCGALFFWSLLCYIKFPRSVKRLVLSLIIYACALLAKVMALSLPVVLLLFEFHRFIRGQSVAGGGSLSDSEESTVDVDLMKRISGAACRLIPFFLISIPAGLMAMREQGVSDEQWPFLQRLLVAFRNLLWYVQKTLLPSNLCPIYPRVPWSGRLVILALVACVAAVGAGVVLFRRHRKLALAYVFPMAAAFAVAIAPVVGVATSIYIDYADRYTYIPSFFIWLGVGALLGCVGRKNGFSCSKNAVDQQAEPGASKRKRMIAIALGVYAAFCAAYSVVYAQAWCSVRSLYSVAALAQPPNPFALRTLGDVLLDARKFEAAIATADRLTLYHDLAITEKIVTLNREKALYIKAFALYGLNRKEEARPFFEAIRPSLTKTTFHEPSQNAIVYAMLADCYLAANRFDQARGCYDDMLRIMPKESYEAHFYRGIRARMDGNFAQALASFEEAARQRPNNAQIRVHISECQQELGQSREQKVDSKEMQ